MLIRYSLAKAAVKSWDAYGKASGNSHLEGGGGGDIPPTGFSALSQILVERRFPFADTVPDSKPTEVIPLTPKGFASGSGKHVKVVGKSG